MHRIIFSAVFEEEAHVESIRICRKIPTRKCSEVFKASEVVCVLLHETVCETQYKTVDVVEDKVKCEATFKEDCNQGECIKVPQKVSYFPLLCGQHKACSLGRVPQRQCGRLLLNLSIKIGVF